MDRSIPGRVVRRAAWTLFPDYMERRTSVSFYPKIKEAGVAFIHIPKAAGMSLSEAIYGEQIGHLKWHHVHASNPRIYDSLLKFAICRDPLERAASAFHFLKIGGINETDRRFSASVLADFEDFEQFVLALADRDFLATVQKKVHFHTQESFVCDRSGRIMVDHLIHIGRLSEDVPNLPGLENCGGIPHSNRTPERQKATELSGEAEAILRDIYRRDFELMDSVLGTQPVRGKLIGGARP